MNQLVDFDDFKNELVFISCSQYPVLGYLYCSPLSVEAHCFESQV